MHIPPPIAAPDLVPVVPHLSGLAVLKNCIAFRGSGQGGSKHHALLGFPVESDGFFGAEKGCY
jgi:hypothetical protein